MNTSTLKRAVIALVISGLAYLALNVWKPYSVLNILFAILLFILLINKSWNKAIYLFIAGLSYNYITAFLSYSAIMTIGAAVFWPITAGFGAIGFFREENNNILIPIFEEATTPIEQEQPIEDEAPVESPATDTNLATTEPQQQEESTTVIHVQVQSDSNVRSGPGTEFPLLFVAKQGESYIVLERSADETWYKIESAEGQTGWIGSTRVTEVSP